ncbi:MAG: DoxX family protein [Xanthomonadaceae bacterium]|nr:DoxX family protein [Xanthomonadaceae bacterium]
MNASATTLLGRAALASIFVLSGAGKLAAYAGTQQYMESVGVPGALLPLVILAELGGGLALVAGLLTRVSATGLALFSVVAAGLFHADFADQNQMIHFLKNIAMAGGLLVLAAHGAGRYSVDALITRRSANGAASLLGASR